MLDFSGIYVTIKLYMFNALMVFQDINFGQREGVIGCKLLSVPLISYFPTGASLLNHSRKRRVVHVTYVRVPAYAGNRVVPRSFMLRPFVI